MASLQDQLLKAGLIDKKKAQASKKTKNKQKYQQTKGKEKQTDEAKLLAEKALQEQAERSRELNRQQRAEAERVAIQAQIRQLITMNRINRSQGELAYQFADGNKIQSIYVTDTLQQQLADGIIAIVRLGESYELIPRQVIDKIAQRDESCIVVLNDGNDQAPDEDDPYADFQIPDDLMW